MRCGNISTIWAAACCQLINDASRWIAHCGPSSILDAPVRSGALALRVGQLRDNLFLDVAQTVLAEIDLVADEEGRGAERTARHRASGVLDQLLLNVILLGPGEDAIDVEPGRQECFAEDLRVVHLFGLYPHVVIGGP